MNSDLLELIIFKNRKTNKIILSIVIYAYLLTQLILYIFSIVGKLRLSTNITEYVGIILNFALVVMVLIFDKNKRHFEAIFLICGLFYTCLADYYLIITGKQLVVGMIFFCLAQSSYLIKQQLYQEKHFKNKSLLILLGLIISVIEIMVYQLFKENYDLIIFLSTLYAVLLVTNTILAFWNWRSNPLMPIGFILFILCDVNVGLNYIINSDSWYNIILNTAIIDIITVFYMPSQVLLSLTIFFLGQGKCNLIKNKL